MGEGAVVRQLRFDGIKYAKEGNKAGWTGSGAPKHLYFRGLRKRRNGRADGRADGRRDRLSYRGAP